MKSYRLKPCAAAVAIAALQMANPAFAASCTWVPGTGNWQSGGNWSCGVTPGSGDSATIALGKTVTIDLAQQITTLANAGTINIDAFTLTLLGGGSTINTGTINVGGASTAALQVQHDITNTSGTINVGSGSVINQFGTAITGGTIHTSGTGALVASNSGNNFLNGVTLNGVLDLATNTGIERISGGLTLNGSANINANSVLAFQGDQTVGGTGTIVFGATGSSNRINTEAGNLTIGSGITIRGENGTIGQQSFVGGAASLTNNGHISADVAGGTISLSVGGPVTNNGVLEAKNGGTLVLNSNIAGGSGSSINAAAGSTVLQNGVTLSGAINTTGTGSFIASNSGNNMFDGVTLNGKLDLATQTGIERAMNGLTLVTGSSIAINNNSVLGLQGNQTLGGSGTVVFGSTGSSNRLNVEAGDLVIGSNIVIRGENGTIGQQSFVGGAATLTNNGRISADVANGTITIGVAGTVTNNGTLEAQNGGTLVLNNSIIGNAGSHIDVGAGSTILQNGVTLQGIVNSAGGGSLRASNNGNNFFDGVTLTGTLDLASQTSIERVKNTFTVNGGININQNSILAFEGNQTISGTGTVVLGATGSSNRVNIEAGDLVLGSGITIRGENGTIGQQSFVGGAATLTNNGRISADVNGGTITLGVQGLTTNNGVLEAKNGGTLVLNSNIAGTASGSINSGAGSTVLQNGIVISGIINTTGSGAFRSSNTSANVFDTVTLNGNLDLATTTGFEVVRNNLALNGNVAINANSVLAFVGDQTLNGNATITLGGTGSSNRVNVEAGTLTLSSGTLIHGENGTIGLQAVAGGPSTLVNNGRISADVAGGNFNLSVSGLTNNNGTIEARNGGSLTLSSAVANAAGGQISAVGAGSRIVQNGVTVSGGTIGGTGGGTYAATNTGSNVLSNVSVGGSVDLASTTGVERVVGGMNFAGGSIAVDSNSILAFSGDQSVTGTGTIVLGATGASNRVVFDAGNLTLGSGVTIRGQNGTIGQQFFVGGTSNVTNNGTIVADVSGGVIGLSVAGTLVNGGTLAAANGGTLNVGTAFTGTGTVQTASGGTFAFTSGGPSSTAGRLVNDGNLSLGTNNLTISSDYSNANFGSGNSFNKRANVTGTGQILAAGDVAQAVTGANVTNGASGTPTLTIRNVRVGGTTYNYQVANSGTTGPAIRGAIQTAVNGGNITDARLSGTGVTAGNYGPVAAGGNSGNLAVTFTASSAGALAPLSGQSVHIANNFDNLGEQTLNIALAGGAAAYNAAVGSATPSPAALGNTRVGGTLAQTFTVRNTATAGAFSEDLNAAFGTSTGATTNGSVNGLVAGGVNSSAMSASLNTATSGARTGSVTINYATAGTVAGTSNGLGTASVGSQTIALSGNVYQAAAGTLLTAPLNFGTVQVGQSVSQALSVRNSATGAAGFVEDLNASFGAATGTGASLISGTGSIAGLTAGSTGGGLTVGVNTSAAGTVNGSIAVNFVSAGAVAGISNGLGTLAVGSAAYGVAGTIATSANVVNQASPVIDNAQPIVLGNVRIGSTAPSALVSVTNQATVAPQAALDASITGNGPVTASGSFNLLNPGATNNTSLSVGFDTTSAGNKSGTATVAFVSDASNIGNCAPNCQLTIASQNVAVTGAVYRLANPVATPSTVTVAGRVGSASPTTAINVTNSSPDIYTEGLNVTRGATSAGFTSTGGVINLAAGGTSGAIGVTLNTATAGTFSGTQALNYVSTGAGTTGAADLAIGGGSVTLNGKVYTPAVATVNTPSVAFGIVHVGDTVSQGVSVTNSAPTTALNDVLVASSIGATGPFTAGGSLGAGLAAQQTSIALTVGLNTTTAGIYNGQASFSAASHDADLSDAALANLVVGLTGQVNNYASDAFHQAGGAGTLSRSGTTWTLDFGTVALGSGTLSSTLLADNSATGPADLLDGNFQFLDAADFGEGGFASFLSVAAGQSTGPLTLSFDALTLGSFMDTIVLHGVGHNASGYSAAIGDIQLVVRGTVTGQVVPPTPGVPEPDSLLLLGLGIPLLFVRRRKAAR